MDLIDLTARLQPAAGDEHPGSKVCLNLNKLFRSDTMCVTMECHPSCDAWQATVGSS